MPLSSFGVGMKIPGRVQNLGVAPDAAKLGGSFRAGGPIQGFSYGNIGGGTGSGGLGSFNAPRPGSMFGRPDGGGGGGGMTGMPMPTPDTRRPDGRQPGMGGTPDALRQALPAERGTLPNPTGQPMEREYGGDQIRPTPFNPQQLNQLFQFADPNLLRYLMTLFGRR